MELVRVSTNAWGQSEVLGAAWDPFWVFVAAGAAFVVVHALAMAIKQARTSRTA